MSHVLHKEKFDLSYFHPTTSKKGQQYYSSKIMVPYPPTRISLFHYAVCNVITVFYKYEKEKEKTYFNSHNHEKTPLNY